MNEDAQLLSRYLDGELSVEEAELVRARLAESPELACRLHELQRVGELVRFWADGAGRRADGLLEPTLGRVQAARRRARHGALGLALAAALVVALPWSNGVQHSSSLLPLAAGMPAGGAAIERIEAGAGHAQVFVVGRGRTPVVWLADDAEAEDAALAEQDPG